MGDDTADIPAGKLRLHLLAERALGLTGLPVGSQKRVKKAPAAVPVSRPLPVSRPVAAPSPVPASRSVPVSRPVTAAAVVRPTASVAAPVAVSGGALFGDERDKPFVAPPLSVEEKRVRLEQMDTGEVRGCTSCRLCETRTRTVFGEGDPDARLMFIGEGPGENEDLSGRPFVGRAGELLEKQINAMGLKREQVFIANVVKCRPPENRTPLPDETAACTPYLMRQIEIIRPKVIVTLGLPATKFVLGDDKIAMGRARGHWHKWRGIAVRPTYHPAYLLRNYTPETRRLVWEDLQEVMAHLGLTKS